MQSSDCVIEILKRHISPSRELSPTTEIVSELGIDGDDAVELIEELYSFTNIEVPHHIYDLHFHSEGELLTWRYPIKWLLYKLGVSSSPPLRRLKPLTVKELTTWYVQKAH